jgi:YVTN family beta-propeller protein
MKLTTEITKVKDWVFDGLATRRSVKLVAGLVLGAVMLSGTAVYFGPDLFPGKLGPIPGDISSNELSGNTFRIREEQRVADRQEDFKFMLRYWNQLERDTKVDTTVKSNDMDALSIVPVNESSGETFLIREEQRATDRADYLKDMIQYWNQLQQSAANGTLWVTNRPLNNVTVFDSGTGDVLGTIPVGDVPIGVTAPPGTEKVYVSNDTPDTVSVIDKSSLSVVETIPMGDRPHHMTHSPNGKFVYVAEFGANTVGVIDTDSDTVVAHYTAGTAVARTHAVWVTRDGKTLYVTNSVEDTIAALDAQTGAPLWTLPVGTNPSEILVTPDGKTGYVTVRGEDKVKVVDLTVPEIVGEVVVGVEPDTLQLTPDLKTLVVALRGTPAQVALVDTRTLAVTPVTITPGATTGHQWLSANGSYTFVAVEDPGSVAVILNSTATVVAIYPYPGGGRPHGVFHEAPQLK